ncbi:MAG TPA: hypothetical protein GX711_01025 [Clostridia bacterium]|nr:hypothetical protein [Clostridia bacterium]
MEKMPKLDLEIVWPRLQGFYPYMGKDGGNYTEVILGDGQRLTDPRKTETVLRALARVFALDIKLIQRRARQVLKYGREVPLAFFPDLVLVPMKTREAPFKDAGTVGYVVLCRISHWEPAPEPYRTRIFFEDGAFLDTITIPTTVRRRLAEAQMILEEFRRYYPYFYPTMNCMEETRPTMSLAEKGCRYCISWE